MKRLGMLAGVALAVGIGSAAMAGEDDIYAANEPVVVACKTGSCGKAVEEPTAATLPQRWRQRRFRCP